MEKLSTFGDTLPAPLITALPLLIAVASLSGCGGGGGSSTMDNSVAPAATSSTLSTNEDSPVNGTLAASDADGDQLSYSIVSPATIGTVNVTDAANGAFTYIPNPDANGTDIFSFKVNDGSTDSNTATVTVTVLSVGDEPVAQTSSLATNEDTATNGTLNASDGDGDTLTYSIVSNGTLGTVSIIDAETGTFTYTPDPDANGIDTFTFKANDGATDSQPATVTLTIVEVNDPPVAAGGCGTTPQSVLPPGFAGTFLAYDPDLDLLTYSLIDPADGLPAGQGPITTATGGTVSLTSATGDFSYQPASSGARGIDSFDYQVSDLDGAVASATQTVIVDQKIMPLGDSITRGFDFDNPDVFIGYRKPLYGKLISSGFTFDFVGTLSDGSGTPSIFDPDHEGHGGWKALEIAQGGGRFEFPSDSGSIFEWLNDQPADVILLHIGTNDIFNFGLGNASDVAAILNEIDRWENVPNNPVTVILARIIDKDPFPDPAVSDFNDAVEAMVNQRIANGDDIIMVDQYSALTYPATIPNDMSDDLHPNTSGYGKMADVWFAALSQPNPNFDPDPVTGEPVYVIDKCP